MTPMNLTKLCADLREGLDGVPTGAIENGRVFAERIEATGFECEAGRLSFSSDWQEFRRCFEHLAEWATNSAVLEARLATEGAGGAEPVTVKQLEWDHAKGNMPGQEVWSSGDPWMFWIVKNPDSDFVWCESLGFEDMVPASPVRGSFKTLEAAKAAAQADYEARIRSALVAAPVPAEPTTAPAAVPEGWQPIETAPKDEMFIWAAPKPDGKWGLGLAYRNVSGGWSDACGDSAPRRATHWMPLPAAPQPGEA